MSARSSSFPRRAFVEVIESAAKSVEESQIERLRMLQSHREIEARNRLAIQGAAVRGATCKVDECNSTLERAIEEGLRCADFLREKVLHRSVSVDDIRRWEADMAAVKSLESSARDEVGRANNKLANEKIEYGRCSFALRQAICKAEKYRVAIDWLGGVEPA